MAVFPDSIDIEIPMFGYLPAKMPYGLSEKLKSLGVNLMNTKMKKTVCVDRKLITSASSLASNELGTLAANISFKELKLITDKSFILLGVKLKKFSEYVLEILAVDFCIKNPFPVKASCVILISKALQEAFFICESILKLKRFLSAFKLAYRKTELFF